jgi:hypothetical protein
MRTGWLGETILARQHPVLADYARCVVPPARRLDSDDHVASRTSAGVKRLRPPCMPRIHVYLIDAYHLCKM